LDTGFAKNIIIITELEGYSWFQLNAASGYISVAYNVMLAIQLMLLMLRFKEMSKRRAIFTIQKKCTALAKRQSFHSGNRWSEWANHDTI
jgi:hypothetical protein